MPVALAISWAVAGAVSGAVVQIWTRRLLTINHAGPLTAHHTAPLLTAVLFGLLAWRFGWTLELVAYSNLAAIGVALSVIDIIERRLPNKMVLSSFVALTAIFAASTIANADETSFLRAVASSAAVAGFYLMLALVSDGGLGAGDVKLGGLLGLALGWLGWRVVLAGVFLGWFFGAITWLTLRRTRFSPQSSPLPAGPFLLLGAMAAIGAAPPA